MPQNWKTYKLGELAKLRKKNLKPSEFSDEKYIGLEHIGQGNFLLNGIGNASDATSNKSIFKKGDILYGKIRPYFQKVVRPNFSGICSTDILIIQTKDEKKITQSFLHQIIKSNDFTQKATETSSGTKMPRADWKSLENLDYNLPPLPEQKAIANILSAIDAKIENNLAINKTLEEMAMALYKEWFVDFGPFQDGKFTESELGMIPEGWEVRRLGDFVTHQKGFAFKSKWYKTEGELVVRVSDTTHNSINIDSCHKISNELAEKYKSYSLNTDDVIIATVGSWPPNYSSVVGKVIRVPKTAEGGLLNQNAVRLKMSIDNKQYQALLYCILKNDRFLNYIINSAQGSASQASIKLIDIFNYPIIITHSETFNSFSTLVESFITKQNLNTVQNQSLTQLRDTLLPKLISGEVRLKDLDLEEVLEE